MDMSEKTLKNLLQQAHPSTEELLNYAYGALDASAAAPVEAHLRKCSHCTVELKLMRQLDAGPAGESIAKKGYAKPSPNVIPLQERREQESYFWLGEQRFKLEPCSHLGRFYHKVQDLSFSALLHMFEFGDEDCPISIEKPNKLPFLAPVSLFEKVDEVHEESLQASTSHFSLLPTLGRSSQRMAQERHRFEDKADIVEKSCDEIEIIEDIAFAADNVLNIADRFRRKQSGAADQRCARSREDIEAKYSAKTRYYRVKFYTDTNDGLYIKIHRRRSSFIRNRQYGDLGLDSASASVMISLKKLFVEEDIEKTTLSLQAARKRAWLKQWMKNPVDTLSKDQGGDEQPDPFFLSSHDLDRELRGLKRNRARAGLVLFELIAFRPYEALDNGAAPPIFLHYSPRVRSEFLSNLGQALNFSRETVAAYGKNLKTTAAKITGTTSLTLTGVGIGVAAGVILAVLSSSTIGAYIAAGTGYKGAAAVNHGLAALAGGSKAAGGWGVQGGVLILALGFGILAGLIGLLIAMVFARSRQKINYRSGAKLETALNAVAVDSSTTPDQLQQILRKQTAVIEALEKKLGDLRRSDTQNRRDIRRLEQRLRSLNAGLERTGKSYSLRAVNTT